MHGSLPSVRENWSSCRIPILVELAADLEDVRWCPLLRLLDFVSVTLL